MITTLCSTCEQLATYVIHQDFSTWLFYDYGVNAGLVHPFRSYMDLMQSRTTGCVFCDFFYTFLGSSPPELDQHQELYVQVEFTIAKSLWSKPRYAFNLALVGEQGKKELISGNFEIFVAHGAQSCTDSSSETHLIQMPCEIPTSSNSPECFSLANSWVERCMTAHPECIRLRDSTMPTRVVDVGASNGTEEPRLVRTQGQTGRYITLSYCWGQDGHVTTTRNNIELHCKTIPLQKLPQTLHDAIVITRKMGYRYLWIDALCIVQDDPEDWEREAANMCSVYERGDFCLGALRSTSSGGGLFHNRSCEQVFATVSGINIGIREELGQAHHHVPDTALERRAWTLQERVLTPAMLYFHSEQLIWECRAGWASEGSPNVYKHQAGENASYYATSIHDLKKVVHNKAQLEDIGVWYEIVEEYTRRAISNPNDRFPALHGLAVKFGECTESLYLFGLWSGDLHRGLLWSVSLGVEANQTVKVNESIPSWSWMSMEASISISRKSRSHTAYLLTASASLEHLQIACLPKMVQPGKHALFRNVLKVTGRVVEGACIRASRSTRHCNMITNSSTSLLDYIACDLDRLSSDVARSNVVPQAYFCLLVAQERDDEYSIANLYLILEKAEVEVEDVDPSNCFSRAGFGWSSVRDSTPSGVLSGAVERTIFLV